jgi:hypothetical protein
MMKANKLLLIILLLSVTGHRIFSQHLVAGLSAGVGSYSMADLKLLNESVKPSFNCKLVSDFPPYLYYQFSLLLNEEEYSFGLFYTFQSTGSRISAKDYSGEYYFDLNVQSHNLGLYAAMNLVQKNNFQLSVYAKPGITFSNLDLSEYFTILDTVLADEKVRCVATSFCLEPGIDFSFPVLPSVSIGINAGYCLQMGGQIFHLEGQKESILVIQDTRKKIGPNWSGFRFGISVMYNINLEAHQPGAIQNVK